MQYPFRRRHLWYSPISASSSAIARRLRKPTIPHSCARTMKGEESILVIDARGNLESLRSQSREIIGNDVINNRYVAPRTMILLRKWGPHWHEYYHYPIFIYYCYHFLYTYSRSRIFGRVGQYWWLSVNTHPIGAMHRISTANPINALSACLIKAMSSCIINMVTTLFLLWFSPDLPVIGRLTKFPILYIDRPPGNINTLSLPTEKRITTCNVR